MIRGFSLRSADVNTGHLISVSHSSDRRDVLIKLNSVTATESVAGSSQRNGVIVRRATDGRHLVQTLEDWNHQVRDCRVSSDAREILDFEMATESRIAEHIHRVAAVLPPASPRDFSFESPSRSRVDSHNLTVERLRASFDEDQTSKDFLHLMSLTDVQSALTECQLHQQRLEKDFNRQPAHQTEEEAATKSAERGTDAGTKRGRRSAFMIPGTLWCGPGSDAESYHELGEDGTTDSCCREHDHCPDSIQRWSSNYGIFNYRLYVLSHCDCDRRFKQCLRDARTRKAEVVADWYFNILQLSCFELHYKPTCVEYQGWFSRGACRRSELVPYAEIGTVGPIAVQDRAVNTTLVSTSVVPVTDGAADDEDKSSDQSFVSTGSSTSAASDQ
ncbi:group 3 secretory phospholipase A2-like [Patiria miniata]|uniref:phospholipase A2 n=1 Tax=Patiria miniata TaxID=46514 RepID=A0A913ZB16_PATMI|nr:group 3 secretory phospholipase A2-like [Patiria miniata]